MNDDAALEELGLGLRETAVYRSLLSHPDTDATEIAAACPLVPSAATAALILGGLRERGLATCSASTERYTAVSPAEPLGAAVVQRRDRLQRAELALAELVEAYRKGSAGQSQRELFEVVEGQEAIGRRYLQMQLSARRSIDFFATGGHEVVGPHNTQERQVLDRGLRLRGVVDEQFLTQPSGSDHLDDSVSEGAQIRTVHRIPLKLIVVDDEAALLPLHGNDGSVDPSLVLRGPAVHLAGALFEAVWQRARPTGRRPNGIEIIDARMLRLLMAGLTDAAAASQLGLSVRTVQRRVKSLMARAGATTRLQLGWHARDSRWI